jgi:hypothetical protein
MLDITESIVFSYLNILIITIVIYAHVWREFFCARARIQNTINMSYVAGKSLDGVSVKRIHHDGDLSDVEREVIGRKWTDCLIVFDFDQTLSLLPVIAGKNGKLVRSIKAELRGGDATLQILRRLKTNGATLAILTAKVDTKPGVQSVVAKLKALGIEDLFDSAADSAVDERLKTLCSANQLRAAACGNVIGASHNKAEILRLWTEARQLSIRNVIYVDDCADQVLNVAVELASLLALSRTADEVAANAQMESSTATPATVTPRRRGGAVFYWPAPFVEGFRCSDESDDAVQSIDTIIVSSV